MIAVEFVPRIIFKNLRKKTGDFSCLILTSDFAYVFFKESYFLMQISLKENFIEEKL